MKKVSLLWSEDKTSFNFVINGRVKKTEHSSQKSGLNALVDILEDTQIDRRQFLVLREEIISEGNLPVTGKHATLLDHLLDNPRRTAVFLR